MPIIPKGTSTPLPYKGPNLVLGYHLHFTQLPRHEKLKQDTGLSKGFHITIRFDNGFKNMSKGNAQSACLDHLHKMNTLIGKDYSSPIDIGLSQITKNWAFFLKLYLKQPLKNELA